MFNILFFISLFLSLDSNAWETDQYTLPDEELADIGTQLSQFVFAGIQDAVLEFNLNNQQYSNNDAIHLHLKMAKLVWTKIAPAIAKQEHRDAIWGQELDLFANPNGMLNQKPVLFSAGKLETIYSYSGFHRLLSSSYFVFSSTIKAYGIEYGLDKVGHTFSEGHKYFEKYMELLNTGETEKNAIKIVVNSGITSERSYFGKIVSGVYSNADLAANFLGLLFYQNLFKEVEFQTIKFPAILIQNKSGEFIINDHVSLKNIYRRLVAPHLNEALNPSQYELLQRPFIKMAVKKRCASWMKRYPHQKQDYYQLLLKEVKTLNGMDYGHRSQNLITLGEVCF